MMQPLLLLLGVAVLAALNSVDAAVECYTCITDNPSWASGKRRQSDETIMKLMVHSYS